MEHRPALLWWHEAADRSVQDSTKDALHLPLCFQAPGTSGIIASLVLEQPLPVDASPFLPHDRLK